MQGGGTLWFTDLTTPDSLYIFPVLTGLTFLATVEVCTLFGAFQFYDSTFCHFPINLVHLLFCSWMLLFLAE
jgi:hypothetical protein